MALIKLNSNSFSNWTTAIPDDSVTTAKIADDSIQSLKNRNLIINGAMNVAQRGTSSTTNGYGTVDRFIGSYGTVGVTQSQQTLTSGDPYDLGFRKFLRLTNTSVTTNTAAYAQIFQYIEAQNVATSGWNYVSSSSYITVSFWVRSSLAGTYYGRFTTNDGTAKNYSFEIVLSANTWTKVTKTVPGDSGITVNNDNGIGLQVTLILDYGTDYTTSGHTNDVWQTYNSTDITSDFAQSWNNTAGATFDLTGLQLEVGSVATPFEHESYTETLLKCQRYYTKSYDDDVAPGTNTSTGVMYFRGAAADTVTNRTFNIQFPVDLRSTPTMTAYSISGTSGSVSDCGASFGESSTISATFGSIGKRGVSRVALGSGANSIIAVHFTADAEL